MSTDGPGDTPHPKRVLYERIFVDRAFAEEAVEDRPGADPREPVER
jgi:hypothetical protein